MEIKALKKFQIITIIALLFGLSIVIRQPLFNRELSTNWEALSAHVLEICNMWSQTPSSVHHFDLLGNYSRLQDKFIDDLGSSAVSDRFGNFYYISMLPLAFLLPYAFFFVTGQSATIAGLQVFTLLLHLVVVILFYMLVRNVTKDYRGSQVASLSAILVFLFAPQALFYYQNAYYCTTLVVPFTIGLLICVNTLISDGLTNQDRWWTWVCLVGCVFLGCLTDWQAYFNAFSTAAVMLYLGKRGIVNRSTARKVAFLCTACVAAALIAFCWQNSRIAGLPSFVHTIVGRLQERTGRSVNGMGLNSLDYYKSVARYYASYSPFLLSGALFLTLSIRRNSAEVVWASFRRVGFPVLISALGVALDHLILANHTAVQCYVMINDLIPIGLLLGFAVATFLQTSLIGRVRDFTLVGALLIVCIISGSVTYYAAYLHRPRPFRSAAATILSAAQPSDVIFTSSEPGTAKAMLYYLGRNIEIVRSPAEASNFLSCHQFEHGIFVVFSAKNWSVERTVPVMPSQSPCLATSTSLP